MDVETKRVANKMLTSIAILRQNGQIADDDYCLKFMSGFGQKMSQLDQNLSSTFIEASGVGPLVKQQMESGNIDEMSLGLLSECNPSNSVAADISCGIIDAHCRGILKTQTELDVVPLLKNLLVHCETLEKENLAKIFSGRVWQYLLSPVLRLKVPSHFRRVAIFDASVLFLARILSNPGKQFNTEETEMRAVVLSDLITNHDLSTGCKLVSAALNQNLKSPSRSGLDQKLEELLDPFVKASMEVKVLVLLIYQDQPTVQDFLLSTFEGSNWTHLNPKESLSCLKLIFENTPQEQIQGRWNYHLEKIIDAHRLKEDPSLLSQTITRLGAVNSLSLQKLVYPKIFEILSSFLMNSENPRDLTLASEQRLLSTCLKFCEQNFVFFESGEELWFGLLQISKLPDVPVVTRSKIIDILSQYLKSGRAPIQNLTKEQTILSQTWHFSRSEAWEVLDSFISMMSSYVRLRIEPIPVEHLTNFARAMVEHSNSYIRATSTELLFEILFYDGLGNDEAELELYVGRVFSSETEAIVRRNCSKIVSRFFLARTNSKIRSIMLHALTDLDWEVKEQALEFWSQFLWKVLSEQNYSTFEEFVRILIEFDLDSAFKISSKDYEVRHLYKTFDELLKLRKFVRTKFPSLQLTDLEAIRYDFPTSSAPNCDAKDSQEGMGMDTQEQETQIAVSENVIEDILSFAEVNLIKDCLRSKPVDPCDPKSLFIFDSSGLPKTLEFLADVLFKLDLDSKLIELDEHGEKQIGFESLLDDIIQSSVTTSAMEGIDCF